MYQTRLLKADLSLRVPLALSRRSSLLADLQPVIITSVFPLGEEFFLSASEMKWKPDSVSQPRKFDHLTNVTKEKLVEYSFYTFSQSGTSCHCTRFSNLQSFLIPRGERRRMGKKVSHSKYCSVTGVGHCATSTFRENSCITTTCNTPKIQRCLVYGSGMSLLRESGNRQGEFRSTRSRRRVQTNFPKKVEIHFFLLA